jgi:hypothetical protein
MYNVSRTSRDTGKDIRRGNGGGGASSAEISGDHCGVLTVERPGIVIGSSGSISSASSATTLRVGTMMAIAR